MNRLQTFINELRPLLVKIKSFIYREVGVLSFAGKIVFALLIILMARLAVVILTGLIRKTLSKRVLTIADEGKVATVRSILTSVVRVAVIFIALMLVLDLFGVNTTSVLATAGVGGVAIAFGAQSLVKDVITGIFILMEEQYAVGDVVTVAGVTGAVINITLRVTQLKDYQGNIHYIPNGVISQVQNAWQAPQRAEIMVALAYDVPEVEVIAMAEYIREVVKAERGFHEAPNYRGVIDMQPAHYFAAITALVEPADRFPTQFKMRAAALDYMQQHGLKSQALILKEGDHAQV